MKKVILSLFAVSGLMASVHAQEEGKQGQLTLNNGVTIKGKVVERGTDGRVSIELKDGEVYDYEGNEIKKFRYLSENNNQKKGYIGMTAGMSIPVGKYASIHGAEVGFKWNAINFGYLFHPNIGITGTWFGEANPDAIDITAFGGISVGPLISFPLSNKLALDIKPMVGYSYFSKYPTLIYNDNYYYYEEGNSLLLNGSIQLRYNAFKRIGFIFDGGYSWMNPEFNTYSKSSYVTTISLSLGAAFRF